MDWKQFDTELRALESKIDWRPDAVVGIVRGGVIPAMTLTQHLNVRKFYVIKVSHVGDDRKIKRFEPNVFEKKVLLVEDMIETGKSLKAAKEFLEAKGAEVKTVCLYTMLGSVIEPDIYLKKVAAIVQFPWEA